MRNESETYQVSLFSAHSTGVMGVHKTQPQDDLHNELRSKMGIGPAQRRAGDGEESCFPAKSTEATASPTGSEMGMQPFYISRESSQAAVSTWLEAKGFSNLWGSLALRCVAVWCVVLREIDLSPPSDWQMGLANQCPCTKHAYLDSKQIMWPC